MGNYINVVVPKDGEGIEDLNKIKDNLESWKEELNSLLKFSSSTFITAR